MSFFDDWGWIGNIGEDIIGGIGDLIGIGKDAYDLADTSDYWSSEVGFDGLFGGSDWGDLPWGDLLKAGYAGYRSGEAADDYLASVAPIQGLFSQYLPRIQESLDPVQARKGIRQEAEYRKGLVDPIWEEAALGRQARAKRAGMMDSKPYMGQEQDWTQRQADYLQQRIMPAAEQAYYAQPQRLANELTQMVGLMSGQPMMQPTYQAAQASPWEYALDKLIYKLQEKVMGMFDRELPNIQQELATPEFLRHRQQLGGIAEGLADVAAPVLKEAFGYESPARAMQNLAAQTDLSDGKAVQKTYNQLLQSNPTAANEWLKSVMPVLKQNIEQQKLAATAASGKGTAENQAKSQLRRELIQTHGPVEGNRIFMERMQQGKEDVQAAGVAQNVGVSLFKDATKSREKTRSKMSNIKTAMNTFKQAKAGSGAAAKLSENIITAVFDGSSAKAASEITRIASAGGFVENIGDFVNEALTGVKTQEHYDAFLKVLDTYLSEQQTSYNKQTGYMSGLNKEYDLKVPENVFETAGPKRRKWNPETGMIE